MHATWRHYRYIMLYVCAYVMLSEGHKNAAQSPVFRMLYCVLDQYDVCIHEHK